MDIPFERWESVLSGVDWYKTVIPDLQLLMKQGLENSREEKDAIMAFFEERFIAGSIGLGKNGKNWDAERQPIDTIIIHHTHNPPGMTFEKLSVEELLRLYAPYYLNPYDERDKNEQGKSIYSGHFRNGKQVFWPYHWIIRANGDAEQLLLDNEIGWHAGKWEVNCRSIAIVFDNNYENQRPSDIELKSVAELIQKQYPQVKRGNIFGHREVNPKTTCPSNLFLDADGKRGWKEDLLNMIFHG